MRKIISFFVAIVIVVTWFSFKTFALPTVEDTKYDCRSAILIEASTQKVLYEQNADEALPPASVTKIMTLLIVMEAIEEGKISLSDMVSASAHACSMGGSQIYLEEGEQMSVEELIKSVLIASANDAAVALAEYVAGSEEAFVAIMNKRAEELGLKNTHFENTNGLDDTVEKHVTSARDIAIMSAKFLTYPKVTQYSSIWMDTIRNGEFGLTNTNRLVRFYKGANGLKTGSTSKAKFCVSASATRDGMTLICVVMAAPSRDIRNNIATKLLDYGFANYAVYNAPSVKIDPISVTGGVKNICGAKAIDFSVVVNKSDISKITNKIELPNKISAPVKQGDKLGCISYYNGEELIGKSDVISEENIEAINFFELLWRFISCMNLF